MPAVARPSDRRHAVAVAAVAVLLCLIGATPARTQAPPRPSTRVSAPVPWTLSGETGLMFVAVKADQTAAFEAGIAALKDVLAASQKPARQRQRTGWRVFRQAEPWRAGVVYLFALNPVVRDADYAVGTILFEGLPDDRTIRPAYVASLTRQQSVLDCATLANFGEGIAVEEAAPDTQPSAPEVAATPSSDGRSFTGDLGLVVMNIKADRLGDFEATMGRLKTALSSSSDARLRKQAMGWRVLKPAKQEEGGEVTVVFLVDPPVPGADYTVSRILSDAFPAETGELFKNYSSVFSGGATLLNFSLVADLRQ